MMNHSMQPIEWWLGSSSEDLVESNLINLLVAEWNRFYADRIPLVILLSGTGCMGKSSVASLLAARLNIPTVIQTKTVYSLGANVNR